MQLNTVYTLVTILMSYCSFGQQYTQNGIVHTDIQMFTKNGTQINGNSKEMVIEYGSGDKMVIRIDPHTITTDNIEFNKELYDCILGSFVFVAEVDASRFEYQSNYNETTELESEATINNVTRNVKLTLIMTNKKTTNRNVIVIVGKGTFNIADFNLEEKFPNLKGELIFQFTQNLVVTYK